MCNFLLAPNAPLPSCSFEVWMCTFLGKLPLGFLNKWKFVNGWLSMTGRMEYALQQGSLWPYSVLLPSFLFHPWCWTLGSTSFMFQQAGHGLLQDLVANISFAWNALAHFSVRPFPFLHAQILASYSGCPWLAICDISPSLWASHVSYPTLSFLLFCLDLPMSNDKLFCWLLSVTHLNTSNILFLGAG